MTIRKACMTPDQQRRYIRQTMLPEVGDAGQAKLLATRVLVIGAGGLGSAVIPYLAAAGVGHVGIIDDDRVELSNLARQVIHETGDIGRLKVESASDRVAEINPACAVTTYPFAITAENAEAIIGGEGASAKALSPRGRGLGEGGSHWRKTEESPLIPSFSPEGRRSAEALPTTTTGGRENIAYDIIADGCDNFASRFAVNAACVRLGIPLVSAAIAGWAGQVMTVAPRLAPGSACYQCVVHPDAPEANTCRESGIIGPLAGQVGSMQALEVVRLALGMPAYLGKLAVIDGKAGTQRVVDVARDIGCPICANF